MDKINDRVLLWVVFILHFFIGIYSLYYEYYTNFYVTLISLGIINYILRKKIYNG